MNLYMIALPLANNSGLSYRRSLQLWEAHALDLGGGYTKRPNGEGVWNGPDRLYFEPMACYHVACDPAQWQRLLAIAFELFPDQHAIFHAHLGTATITDRGDAPCG